MLKPPNHAIEAKASFSDMHEWCKQLEITWDLCLHICELEFNSTIYRELIPRELEQQINEMHLLLVDFTAPAACLRPSLGSLGTARSAETAEGIPGAHSGAALRAEESH